MRRFPLVVLGILTASSTACGGGGGGASGGGNSGAGTSFYLYNDPYRARPGCQPDFLGPTYAVTAFEVLANSTGGVVMPRVELPVPLLPGGSPYLGSISLPGPGSYRVKAYFASGTPNWPCDGQLTLTADLGAGGANVHTPAP